MVKPHQVQFELSGLSSFKPHGCLNRRSSMPDVLLCLFLYRYFEILSHWLTDTCFLQAHPDGQNIHQEQDALYQLW